MIRSRPLVGIIGGLYAAEGRALLAQHVDLVELDESGVAPGLPEGLNGIVPRYPSQVTSEMINESPRLLGIAASGRGVDNIAVDTATDRGVLVANNHGVGSSSVAEHTMGLMIAMVRGFGRSSGSDLAEAWRTRLSVHRIDLASRTLGIVGCGNVGTEVAKRASLGFGMHVIAYDPYVNAETLLARGVSKVESLEQLLGQSDVVTLHPELNAETEGMFGDREFRSMKQGSFLINASRGRVVQTAALVQALETGHLAGAALDVYDPEPPQFNGPLSRLPNLVLTPHVADMTVEIKRALALSTAGQMLDMLAGRRPANPVNPRAWESFATRRADISARW